jgi:hypothetical protein
MASFQDRPRRPATTPKLKYEEEAQSQSRTEGLPKKNVGCSSYMVLRNPFEPGKSESVPVVDQDVYPSQASPTQRGHNLGRGGFRRRNAIGNREMARLVSTSAQGTGLAKVTSLFGQPQFYLQHGSDNELRLQLSENSENTSHPSGALPPPCRSGSGLNYMSAATSNPGNIAGKETYAELLLGDPY